MIEAVVYPNNGVCLDGKDLDSLSAKKFLSKYRITVEKREKDEVLVADGGIRIMVFSRNTEKYLHRKHKHK